MLIDSHCHLDRIDLEKFDGSLDNVLDAARNAGVEHVLCVNIRLEDYPTVHGIAERYPDVSCSVGVHPGETDGAEPTVEDLVSRGRDPLVVAVGETGLDYHYHPDNNEWQRERFRVHIRAARELGKPLIIHTRDAREDTIAILREEGADGPRGVMHCFTETWEMARAALDLGFYVSFSGIVTFRNAEALRDVARRVPDDRLLVETDAPYLAPVPHRGKTNHPAWVRDVAARVAEVRGTDLDTLAELTNRNYDTLFGRG
ncbi:TatD family deoxyribonuclease [Thioalkalivibrio denitrificans]|uniref:TatD family deoxyribonuclease n=1 Tax=Thioalkalivibrio denitrificans TaxID=108003 RepID=A0A1V3N7H4_9GAMM|nr:TatD family hydrolase [Thioalkalivibrio denitrificans]OOG21020.1 TatD family deoxyribonuclease [Thioalkalivibrio denitrificans]